MVVLVHLLEVVVLLVVLFQPEVEVLYLVLYRLEEEVLCAVLLLLAFASLEVLERLSHRLLSALSPVQRVAPVYRYY